MDDRKVQLLCGWKQIASHLGISVRTAQRYGYECGLPVHKATNKKRAAVFAIADELDAWVGTRPNRTVPSTMEATIHDVREFTYQLRALQTETHRLLVKLSEKASRFQRRA